MLQSSLLPGLLFHLCSSDQLTRLPVRKRIVSSAESQNDLRTSTNTPSTSNMRILGSAIVFGDATQELKQKISSSAMRDTDSTLASSRHTSPASCLGHHGFRYASRFHTPRHINLKQLVQLLQSNRLRQIAIHSTRHALLAISFHRVRCQRHYRLAPYGALLFLPDGSGR